MVLTITLSRLLLGLVLPHPIWSFSSGQTFLFYRAPAEFQVSSRSPPSLSTPFPAIQENLSLFYLYLSFMNRIWDSTLKRFSHPSKCDTQNPNPVTAWFVCTFIYANFITESSHWDQSGPNSSLDEWIPETSKQLSEPLEEGKDPQNSTLSRKNKFPPSAHPSWTSRHGLPLSPF